MKYVGSKQKIAKSIVPIMLKYKANDEVFVEPFCVGCNVTEHVIGNRLANDSNFYIIEMWKALQEGWIPPKELSRSVYEDIRDYPGAYQPYLVGYVGINFSYSGKWFGGYAGKTVVSSGKVRDYPLEAYNNVMKQVPKLKGVQFVYGDYKELEIPKQSLVYCDPPYAKSLQYLDIFDTKTFWEWVRQVSKDYLVFISEYEAPEDFTCIWKARIHSSLSANGVGGGSLVSVEKLFVHESLVNK